MMNLNRNSFFGASPLLPQLPSAVKNLVIINVLFFLASSLFEKFMVGTLAMYFPLSPHFKFFQPLTYMFMHGNFIHLFFNMYALWIFGSMLEQVWGVKKFLRYYFIAGIGAAVLHVGIQYIQYLTAAGHLTPDALEMVFREGPTAFANGKNFVDADLATVNEVLNIPMLGASGAVYGLLLAFGLMFPNAELQLLFPPVRLKAIWFVSIFAALELFLGITNTNEGVAHFAHLGGMLAGFVMVAYWRHRNRLFRNED
jgi:membrane associated rhomboid family serine protease